MEDDPDQRTRRGTNGGKSSPLSNGVAARALDTVLAAVKRIVADVRKQGDRALLRYAAQFDGLAGASSLRVTPDEMAAA